MGVRVTTGRTLLAAVLGFGVALSAQAAEYPDIGPLPQLKINKAKAELGKRLFFDKRLSGDAAVACATCHVPEKGYASKEALSPGYPGNGHFRNASSLINVAHRKVWNWDGRIGTNLNDMTREMLTEDYTMNMDMRIMQERVKQDPVYVRMFKDAGYGEPSNGSVRKAIPEYLKTLTSANAPFDTGKMSASAKRGMKLFKGKGGCIQCHNGPMMTDQKAHNTGVPENFDVFMDPMNHQAFIAFTMFQGIPNYMNLKRDPGYYNVTLLDEDMGKFLTPSLRELKYSAPYMHNGMIKTLAGVVDFYNQGGGKDSRKSGLLKPLKLSGKEKKDLVAFLEALSGDPLTSNKHVWKQPYPSEYEAIANWTKVPN
ncbi:MAG: photosynthetic protein synthase I [Candidatus Thiodiazotropha sp. (ex Epidulcina cf. delphinae)]|nr:photosynthetic protein synthase I [Candidatus Thiodiazotropha sp. (ex Epidulcina cf. delphinae)]